MADYNLPNGMTGLEVIISLRKRLGSAIPALVLTGDISSATLRAIATENCVQLSKPVKLERLAQLIHELLPAPRESPSRSHGGDGQVEAFNPVISLIDDSMEVREGIRSLLEGDGRTVRDYPTAEAFLEAYDPAEEGCLLVDAYLPGMSGVELLHRLHADGHRTPAIIITGSSDVSVAIEAMKAGALDFIEKPAAATDLLASVDLALEHARDTSKLFAWEANAARSVSSLTPRQREVMDLVLAGHPSKNIAVDLGISQRTVETHRATIMKKTASRSLPALARVALAAATRAAPIVHLT